MGNAGGGSASQADKAKAAEAFRKVAASFKATRPPTEAAKNGDAGKVEEKVPTRPLVGV